MAAEAGHAAAAVRLLEAAAEARVLLLSQPAAANSASSPAASPAAVARRRQERGELEAAARLADARDENDVAPLHLAAQNGHAHVAAALLEAGADVAARDDGGCTPLMEARLPSRALPPTASSSPSPPPGLKKNSAGLQAARGGHEAVAALLLAAGQRALLPVDAESEGRCTALQAPRAPCFLFFLLFLFSLRFVIYCRIVRKWRSFLFWKNTFILVWFLFLLPFNILERLNFVNVIF